MSLALRRRSSLSVWQHVETGREKSAEAVVAAGWACREGLNPLMQGASRRRLDGRGAAARRVLPTIPLRGDRGEPAPRPGWRSPQLICPARGATSVRGVRPSTSLECKPGEILRPGEPRHPDVAARPSGRRQASVAYHPSLPGSGDAAKRRVRRTARRDAARGTVVYAVGEPASGRPGSGTRTAWTSVLPLRG